MGGIKHGDRTGKNTGLVMFGMLVFTIFTIGQPLSASETQRARMANVIDRMITAYNAGDSVGYRRQYSPIMQVDESLSAVGASLRRAMDVNGPIESHEALISASGDRAIVVVQMASASFDLHLRLNGNGELLRDTWMTHKSASTDPSDLSPDIVSATLKRYSPIVASMVESIRTQDAELLMTLFAPEEEDEDEWTVEDYAEMINTLRDRAGDVGETGPIVVQSSNSVWFHINFARNAYEFRLSIDSDDLITSLKLTNYAPSESEGKSLADLGDDTLKTSDLIDFDLLADHFRADSGKTRFIALLSPT